jgi:hypothetical protein
MSMPPRVAVVGDAAEARVAAMTAEVSFTLPDDVAAYLREQEDASAVVAAAVRRVIPNGRGERQRAAAQAYGEYLRQRTIQQRDDDIALIESSNDIALRGAEW